MSSNRRPLQTAHANYAEKTKTAIATPASGRNLVFVGATLNNRAAGAATVGIGFKLHNDRWKAGQWDDSAEPAYTDDTTDAQDAGATDFPLFSLVNDDGFVVQSLDKFGIIGIDVGTAENGAATYALEYWNGTAWTAMTAIEVPTAYTAIEHTIAFSPPADWAPLVAADEPVATDGLEVGYYAVKVDASTASATTAAVADSIWLAKLYDFKEAVADNGVLNIIPEDDDGLHLEAGQSIIPYFGTAHASNSVTIRYRSRG